ncbi:MAG: hypothetical protein U0228_13890 [Myxococcaceae bacterium]
MTKPGKPARLGFFTELDAAPLAALVRTPGLFSQLRALDAHVTVGLRCLSEDRARSVRALRDAGVRAGAWLLLPREHGYFATWDNHAHVVTRVEQFRAWAHQHRLDFDVLGLDFEPPLEELDVFFERPLRAMGRWARRSLDRDRRARALDQYQALVRSLRAEGLELESYQFPLLLEDRAAQSHFFQRFVSSLDVDVGREVLMVYSSLLGPLGPGLTERWTRDPASPARPRAIAVGSTGGGIDPLPKLSFDELARDLRLAARASDDVRVFSLEGCVEHGHLERLIDLDWSAPVSVSTWQRAGAKALGTTARALATLMR